MSSDNVGTPEKGEPQFTICPRSNEDIPASKKPKLAPLHEYQCAPLSFLEEAFEEPAKGNNYFDGNVFGLRKEAFAREEYGEMLQIIHNKWGQSVTDGYGITLAIIRGSSGIGKSVFLAYVIAKLRMGDLRNMALFHAVKKSKSGSGSVDKDEVNCSVWLNGNKTYHGKFKNVADKIENDYLSKVDLIIMDGCSMPFGLAQSGFKGLVLVSASPSLYVKNLQDAFPTNHFLLTMPPIKKEESLKMATVLGVDKALVLENYKHMNGIARYLFQRDTAKRKVIAAIGSVTASTICKMVSMQSTSKQDEQVAVHSLVLWKVNDKNYEESPTFSLVSRFAEQLVAQKLEKETMTDLKSARSRLQPLSGAEGYAGALFEAYAIRTLQAGGQFVLRDLECTDE